jgi:hypothetical protein
VSLRALDAITVDLETVRRSLDITNSPRTKVLVLKLYIVVFGFLFGTLPWHTSRSTRIRNASKGIEKLVKAVQVPLSQIRIDAEQATQKKVIKSEQSLGRIEGTVIGVAEMMNGFSRYVAVGIKEVARQERQKRVWEELAAFLEVQLAQDARSLLLENEQATEHERGANSCLD